MKKTSTYFKFRWARRHHFFQIVALLIAVAALSPNLAQAATAGRFFQQQQLITVKGTVVDDTDGNPLPSVTIVDAQRKTLGVTDTKGYFMVRVPKGTEVSFSFVGYTTLKRTFNTDENNLTVRMAASANELKEVAVTALGIKREQKALGYSVTVVKGEQFTDARSANWTDALSGKVAGLNLVRSNSGPGGSNKIVLRGENNFNSGENEALIVVDGVIINTSSGRRTSTASDQVYGTASDNMPADYGSSINDINPDDIENVSVLKGPGAAALYGARGANGAIIITTKSGSPKRKGFGVTFNSNLSVEQVNRWPDLQYEYGQGLGGAAYYSFGASVDGASTSGTSSAYGPKFDGQMFYQYDPVTQKVGTQRTPWVPYTNKIRDFFDTGNTLTNSVSVDGGTDRTQARFSATNMRNRWIFPNTGYNRNTVSTSVTSKVNDKLTISSKVNYTNNSSDNLPGAGYGNQSIMYWYIFWQPNADPEWLKNYWKLNQEGKAIQYPFSSFPENPYAVTSEFINKRNRNSVTGNIQANYDIVKGLTLQLRTSLDMGYDEREQDRPYDAGSKLVKGSYRTQNIYSQEITSDFLLRYNTKAVKDLEFTVTAGGSTMNNKLNRDELRADSLIYPGLYVAANSAGPLITTPYRSRIRQNSFYGVFSTAYKDYLYLDLTAREDWTSTLATPQRTDGTNFFYPSASLSFVLSDYDKIKLPKVISFAKLRGSVAGVGSGGTTPYITSYVYDIAGGGLYPGGALQNPSILPNANLVPQHTTTYELGADIRLFNSRLGLDVAVYTGKTDNQILNRVVDAASGYRNAVINLGTVQNRGIEVALNGTLIKPKRNGLGWNLFGTFSANRNKITQLGDSSVVLRTGPVAGGQIVAQVGGSMGDLYGRGFVRSPDGQIVYDAATGFAKITAEPVYLGNTIPKFKTSLGSNWTYGSFRLNVLFDAQFGAVGHSLTNYKLVEQGKTTSTLPGRYSGIIGKGVVQNADGTYRPNDVTAYDIDGYYRSQMGVDNAEGSTFSTDFIKFREARIDFTLNKGWTQRLGLQRATLGVYGRDLFIWSPWPIFDPEFGTLAGSDIVQGFEVAQFPSTRTFGVNLTVGF